MREGNNPKRRVVPVGSVTKTQQAFMIDEGKYVGSGHHKRYPLNYGFERTNPVPTKSLCDFERPIRLEEARALFHAGIEKGMISSHSEGDFPKYVWSVDASGQPYESKTDGGSEYHGYPLVENSSFPDYIVSEWKKR